MLACFTQEAKTAVPLLFFTEQSFPLWLDTQPERVKNWIKTQQFTAKPVSYCQIPSPEGQLEKVLIGHCSNHDVWFLGQLVTALPPNIYKLENCQSMAALAWGMGAYQFTKYKLSTKNISQLYIAEKDFSPVLQQLHAIYLVRDLINTPAEDMGPQALAESAENLAKTFSAVYTQIIGEDLITHNYPSIHTVGRASAQAPRLIDLQWGEKTAPKVTLVGKGVCFDSGGLDIKSAQNMALMKKDMGGAAHVLGLAYLIMSANLPVRLRVLIPAVENAVSGNAFRPGDVMRTRKGLTVEIGNTDAEGRLILADALTEASGEQPALLIDMATLTGAARVALGTELPVFFTDDDILAHELMTLGNAIQDPVWRLPLYTPYRKLLNSSIADINNAGSGSYAGAITAALFLKEFIAEATTWLHVDLMAWNVSSSPAHPEGGEAMGLRTVFEYIQRRFCARSSAG